MRRGATWGRLAAAAVVLLALVPAALAAAQTRVPIRITIGASPAVGLAPGRSVTFVVQLDAVGSAPLARGSRLLLSFPNSVNDAKIVRRRWLDCRRRAPARGLRGYECTLKRSLYSDAGPTTPPVVAVKIEASRRLAGKRLVFTAEVWSSRPGDVVVNSKEQRSVPVTGTAKKPPPKAPDITGAWRGGSGGFYTISMQGSRVTWLGYSPAVPGASGKYSWYHLFEGTIRDGVYIVGRFRDDPRKSTVVNEGPLVVKIVSWNRLEKVGAYGGVTSSPAFGEAVWTR